MKKTYYYVIVIALLFSACSGKTSKLSNEDKARNIYQNTITIMTGSMFSAMGNALGEASAIMPYIADTLEKAVNSKMKDFSSQMVQDINSKMSQKFDSLKKANPSVYSKIFNNDAMKAAVDKASKAELPKGFKPITETLDKDDFSRYIIYISLMAKVDQSKAANDPVLKMYEETFSSLTKLDETFKNDPEIAAFLKKK